MPKEGVPVFHDDRMRLLEPPTLWIIHIAQRGRSRRPNTWKSYAADLLDYLHFCEANGINYLEPVRGLLAAYRDQLQTRVITRRNIERPISGKTINHRLGVVANFYNWMLEEGIISSLPFRREERRDTPRDKDKLAHTRRAPKHGIDAAVPVAPEEVPKALSINLITSILGDLGERDADITEVGLSAGPRIDEILALNIDQIPNDQAHSASKSVPVYITKTKGLRPRYIYIPLPVLTDLNRYIYGERARIIKRRKELGKKWDRKALFLSQNGRRLSYKTYWSNFRKAADKASCQATPHSSRHTYAIYTLARLRAASRSRGPGSGTDPLFQLQMLLGHMQLSSTQIYVRALDENPQAAEDAMHDFVKQWRQRV